MTELEADVAAFIQAEPPEDEATFEALALRVFEHQYETIEVVRRLADHVGRPPAQVKGWRQIPSVPTSAFKDFELFSGRMEDVHRVFESSGTSGKPRSRSPFSGPGLELMDLAIRANAQRSLLPDRIATRILVLAPTPELAPSMIMAWGMQQLIQHFGAEGSRFLINRDGLDHQGLDHALRSATDDGLPITLIGASFGFVHLLDGLAEGGVRYYCVPGSRAMDAGGFKGRSRTVTRDWLARSINDRFEIPGERCVNLLGMTELASQMYDGVLANNTAENRRKTNAHWTRTRVLDPTTLQPVPLGGRGLLQHLDLANVERPLAIQTDDLGSVDEHGWEVHGRAAGSDAKGCSLTVEEMLEPKVVPLPRRR
ncbi:MAG: hypothetical protein ACI9WU_002235 [Myxococcota bacterium]|jgi:hypothetical protein